MVTEASKLALENLRNTANLQWYVIPLLLIAIYIYNNELEKGRKEEALLGIFWFCIPGVVLEIINALVLHFTQYSALWTTPGNSAFVIYVGWNVEIAFLAAVVGLINIKSLPKDKNQKIFGIPNRIFFPIVWTGISVFIEVMLNLAGILVWDWWFWNWPNIYFIVIWWMIPNLILVWLYDHINLNGKKKLAIVSVIVALSFHVVFAMILHWV